MITVTYHVTVPVPVLVWQHFRDSAEYFQAMCAAFTGNTGGGHQLLQHGRRMGRLRQRPRCAACRAESPGGDR